MTTLNELHKKFEGASALLVDGEVTTNWSFTSAEELENDADLYVLEVTIYRSEYRISEVNIDQVQVCAGEFDKNDSLIVEYYGKTIKITPLFSKDTSMVAINCAAYSHNEDKLNSSTELASLASKYEGELKFENPTQAASEGAIEAARRLVQMSTDSYSIVIPNGVQCIWSGEGSGEWLPAMVFVANHEIF